MLRSEGREVVFRCTNCGSGYAIVNGELGEVKVSYCAPNFREAVRTIEHYPFWLLRARVNIRSRSASGGFFSAIFGKDGVTEGRISFYVPAFDAPLETLKKLGMLLTRGGFSYATAEAEGAELRGCVHSEQFARGFADFILLSMEAEKGDTLRAIDYDIEFEESEVLAVPFAVSDGRLRELLLGTEVPRWNA